MKKKNKAQVLIELVENKSTREMVESTDAFGGHLKSGWKKCSV